MGRTLHRRLALFLCTVLTVLIPSWVTGQPQSALQRVVTGKSERLPTSDVDLLRIRFEAGSRTYWHAHENAQIYLVEEGLGRFQIQGQDVRDVGPGEPAYLPPKHPHWHGAAPDESATCLHAYPGGVAITMMREVTEQEYLGASSKAP